MGGSNTKDLIYAVPVGEKPEGSSHTYRNAQYKDELLCFPPNCKNLQDILLQSAKKYPKNNLLGKRNAQGKYEWLSYEECIKIAEAIGTTILERNLYHQVDYQPHNMKLVGIFSKNRTEWLLTEYGNFLYDFTMVPLYDTLGPDSIDYVLNQTELTTIVASAEAITTLLKCKNPGKLHTIIAMDQLTEEQKGKVQEKGWQLLDFWGLIQEFQNTGKKAAPYAQIDSECIFTFSYTSGTTGDPKGALLSHTNMSSVCYLSDVGIETPYSSSDVYLSYLPLPHVLERLMVCVQIYQGGSIGFYSGNPAVLKDDLAELKPTVFASVPRLYNKFYDVIKSKLYSATGLKGHLAKSGLQTKLEYNKVDNSTTHKFWDKLVFNKTKAALGGRVKICATGGAPISADVLQLLKVTLCVPIQEGYGSTESTGASFSTSIYDPEVGHVGGIKPNMEFKLEDIPDMSYLSTDKDENGNPTPRGEICIRGHSIFKGYYKLPEKTAESIDSEGWLHTGDVGLLKPNGSLKIIDRKKNLFKLAQGEYIAPEKIENIYVTSPYADEVFIYGDTLQSTLITFIVPSKPKVEAWAKENSVTYGSYEELLQNKQLRKFILADLNVIGKKSGLYGFEQARNIQLEPKPFGDLGITTNTFKIKRKEAREHYEQAIKTLYEEQL